MDGFPQKLDDRTIQFVRILPGPMEKVWDYLADSKKRGQWFASGDLPKVGERFEMRFKHNDLSPNQAEPPERMKEMAAKGHTSSNVLLAFEPPHRMVFTFGGEKDPALVSEVEFKLTQEGPVSDNKVRFTITHSKIPNRDIMKGVSGGWHSHLAILEYRARGETPPAFWDIWRKYEEHYAKQYA